MYNSARQLLAVERQQFQNARRVDGILFLKRDVRRSKCVAVGVLGLRYSTFDAELSKLAIGF
jgi:hypothetical protein